MAVVSLKDLLESGVHYGHRTSRWNPKMEEFIFGKRNSIHIVDLTQTVRGIVKARRFLKALAQRGEWILLVGTKRQAATTVRDEALRVGMPYVSHRWLGGTLTNFQTIRRRLKRLEELEAMEESGSLEVYSKKMVSMLMREKRKIHRNLDGIRQMEKLPAAMIVFDPTTEHNAVHEANLLDIPIISLLDTDADPDLVDIHIPGNDDAVRSIRLVAKALIDAVEEGLAIASEGRQVQEEQQEQAEEIPASQPEEEVEPEQPQEQQD